MSVIPLFIPVCHNRIRNELYFPKKGEKKPRILSSRVEKLPEGGRGLPTLIPELIID